ncbi:AbrB/MazE/SpoVT family DNA-binding domain-containing protein [Rathayibacter soli]|uniref:AbrB/MazE/SpoVT family DNA-binding domain-containing protein n=1 Tax=Rathayibacter soli TaxID=3144168 RepID=UPI0027E57969|nr:AbrB/MazE/SpoVT family DNA-binding domain-containing protein [Glaciibacter superstes]
MKAIVTLSSKGQLTLPAAIRHALGLSQGDRLEVTVDAGEGSVKISPLATIEELSAHITGYAAQREPVTDVDAYYQAHRNTPK